MKSKTNISQGVKPEMTYITRGKTLLTFFCSKWSNICMFVFWMLLKLRSSMW